MSRCIIVSNRLPFKKDHLTQELVPAAGGLVTALREVELATPKIWMGAYPGEIIVDDWQQKSTILADSTKYVPIPISKALYNDYYNGFCNDVLWPLLHYQTGFVDFTAASWKSYQKVNRKFADAILKIAEADDIIWIHDFHLFLLPALLKEKRKSLRIGFFLHVPFPSSEFFRELPVREDILKGLLGADLIGFHDYSYLQHFCKALSGILGIDVNFFNAHFNNRTTHFGVFPIGIEAVKLRKRSMHKNVVALSKKYKKAGFVFLGIDRLDYTKGLDLKIKAFREFLLKYPHYHSKVSLIQVAVPTREQAPRYIELKKQIEQLVGAVNGEFGTPEWTPIQYLYTNLTDNELLGLYRMADTLMVTSKRDGMNLVVLEYIAAQNKRNPGSVILSEFAGAISILSHVIAINPWDIESTAAKMVTAIEMPVAERTKFNQEMFNYLSEYTSTRWAASFIDQLQKMLSKDIRIAEEIHLNRHFINQFKQQHRLSGKDKITLILDYDGTLASIEKLPGFAVLSSKTRAVIARLAQQKNIKIIIVSGRNGQFLRKQFADLNVGVCAEHGAKYFSQKINKWQNLVLGDCKNWYTVAEKMMYDYSIRVPGSFIEKKQFSITWHYRNSPSRFANYQALKLTDELETSLAKLPATVISGKKVIEVCAVEANKGRFLDWYFHNQPTTATLLILGDDQTDEAMFNYARENQGVAVKVGRDSTRAHYRLLTQTDVLPFLTSFINKKNN